MSHSEGIDKSISGWVIARYLRCRGLELKDVLTCHDVLRVYQFIDNRWIWREAVVVRLIPDGERPFVIFFNGEEEIHVDANDIGRTVFVVRA